MPLFQAFNYTGGILKNGIFDFSEQHSFNINRRKLEGMLFNSAFKMVIRPHPSRFSLVLAA